MAVFQTESYISLGPFPPPLCQSWTCCKTAVMAFNGSLSMHQKG